MSTYPGGVPGPELPNEIAPRQANLMATLSLIFAFVCNPLGLVFGLIALSQIKNEPNRFSGKSLALVGVVLSALFLLIGGVLTYVFVIAAKSAVKQMQTGGGPNGVPTNMMRGAGPQDGRGPGGAMNMGRGRAGDRSGMNMETTGAPGGSGPGGRPMAGPAAGDVGRQPGARGVAPARAAAGREAPAAVRRAAPGGVLPAGAPGKPGAGNKPVLSLPGRTEVEKAAAIQEFAALYGTSTWVKEKNWDGMIVEWVTLTYDRQNLKLPLSLVLDARQVGRLPLLKGYFVLFNNTGFGKVLSKQVIKSRPELKDAVLKMQKGLYAAATKAAAPAPAEGAEQAGAGGAGGRGMGGGAGRGGRGMGGGAGRGGGAGSATGRGGGRR